jgi:ABC-type sugar transport system permease subunit
MTSLPPPSEAAATGTLGGPAAKPTPPPPPRGRLSGFLRRSKTNFFIYALLLPTLLSMGIFGYYPKIDVFVKSVYRWNPGKVLEYVGAKNYLDAFADPIFWQSFRVVAIMLVANLFKMWPGIIVAIALHRLLSDRWRYIYQVCFVIPMVVPMMVWLLVWKSFFDPDFGILNRLLNITGLMPVLGWLDGTDAAPGIMPQIASALDPVIQGVINPLFGGVWAMILVGAVCLTILSQRLHETGGPLRWLGYAMVLAMAVLVPLLATMAINPDGGSLQPILALVIFIALMVGLAKGMGPGWVIWPFLLLYGVWACYGEPVWRLPVLLAVGIAFAEVVGKTTSKLVGPEVLRWTGMALVGIGGLFVAFGLIWTEPTNQFVTGRPAWLGNEDLILPALILWGFPWVGTVGVLIYLAGLQQISTDVYEAAELDGVSPIGKLFQIELPLIMTQIRINLIMMTIGTLTAYEFFLILLGPDGGPGNVGMVPGLYMYKSAFFDSRYGYACALGMVLFVVILLLTIVYQKYVKVDK